MAPNHPRLRRDRPDVLQLDAIEGHITPVLYEPVVRVPLLISAPGQKSRQDVNATTNSVDVLPTLARLAGVQTQPRSWYEGQLLPGPGVGGVEDSQRSIFMMDAKQNTAFSPLLHASFALRKGPYKLVYYKGLDQLDGQDAYELYDLGSDPGTPSSWTEEAGARRAQPQEHSEL